MFSGTLDCLPACSRGRHAQEWYCCTVEVALHLMCGLSSGTRADMQLLLLISVVTYQLSLDLETAPHMSPTPTVRALAFGSHCSLNYCRA